MRRGWVGWMWQAEQCSEVKCSSGGYVVASGVDVFGVLSAQKVCCSGLLCLKRVVSGQVDAGRPLHLDGTNCRSKRALDRVLRAHERSTAFVDEWLRCRVCVVLRWHSNAMSVIAGRSLDCQYSSTTDCFHIWTSVALTSEHAMSPITHIHLTNSQSLSAAALQWTTPASHTQHTTTHNCGVILTRIVRATRPLSALTAQFTWLTRLLSSFE